MRVSSFALAAAGCFSCHLPAVAQVSFTKNPTYSTSVFRNEDPNEYLQKVESEFNRAESPRAGLGLLARAAKAALEAGDNLKARDYAIKALRIADEAAEDRKRRGFRDPRRFEGIPTADYNANFVLGRLAISNGDLRAAEQYLVASGKTTGDAVLRSYGPNMSLALELLKHGDQQSWQAVLEFIKEIRVFWAVRPTHLEEWSEQIMAGKIPNFETAGPNLYN